MISSDKGLRLLKEFVDRTADIGSSAELDALVKEYSGLLDREGCGAEHRELLDAAAELAGRLVQHKEICHSLPHSGHELSEEEKRENSLVQTLLDKNLFTYHFQPIVRADNGEIYAYEALMRAEGMEGITPFHILKYAELSGRLGEVEQYTFMNILGLVNAGEDAFFGKPVFINSMPNVRTAAESNAEIERMLSQRMSSVVIEMVESSEYNDNELNIIKEKYSALGIPIAIDDYGTGYSNISNLLRYTPNFVKIDRSLLSGIEHSPNKKHFVREIIDFCHENKIKALAEGVESSEELRTVILLGADLIQGFYTARPVPEVIEEIPYEIRAEIRAHRQELENGKRLKIYTAEKGEHILLERLERESYSCVQIGQGFRDGCVTVSGVPHHDSGIHIIVSDGFAGEIVLDNARLSNLVGRPCLDTGSGSSVMITLVGSSVMRGGGIRVPEDSSLMTTGDGSLDIKLGGADYYGIGCDLDSRHGRLDFGQDGTVTVSASSHAGVCIGSGLGGEINVGRGRYVFDLSGSSNIGIGAFRGRTDIDILGCDFEFSGSGAYGTGIGSTEGDASVHIIYSSIKVNLDGQLISGIGTLYGRNADIHIESANISTVMNADRVTVLGSLYGDSDICIERSSVKISADGTKALAFGGSHGSTKLSLTDIDLTAKLSTTLDACTLADRGDISTKGGRYRITVNGRQQDSI